MIDRPTTSRSHRAAQACALLVTYAIKLVGLASAFNQLLLTDHATSLALAVSAFMMAGAQFSEGLILALLDRLMASEEHHEAHEARKGGG